MVTGSSYSGLSMLKLLRMRLAEVRFFYEDNPSRHNVSRTLKTVSYISPKLTNTLLVRIFPNLQNSLRDSIKVPKKVAILFYSTKLLCPITGIIRYN